MNDLLTSFCTQLAKGPSGLAGATGVRHGSHTGSFVHISPPRVHQTVQANNKFPNAMPSLGHSGVLHGAQELKIPASSSNPVSDGGIGISVPPQAGPAVLSPAAQDTTVRASLRSIPDASSPTLLLHRMSASEYEPVEMVSSLPCMHRRTLTRCMTILPGSDPASGRGSRVWIHSIKRPCR